MQHSGHSSEPRLWQEVPKDHLAEKCDQTFDFGNGDSVAALTIELGFDGVPDPSFVSIHFGHVDLGGSPLGVADAKMLRRETPPSPWHQGRDSALNWASTATAGISRLNDPRSFPNVGKNLPSHNDGMMRDK